MRFVRVLGEHDGEVQCIVGHGCHAVETIGKVELGEETVSMLWVAVMDAIQQPRKGTAKLHDFLGKVGFSGVIDAPPSVVDEETRSSISFRLDCSWRELEVREVLDHIVRQDNPKAAFTEVRHLISEEVHVLDCRGVSTPSEALLYEFRSPVRTMDENWDARIAVGLEKTSGRMIDGVNPV